MKTDTQKALDVFFLTIQAYSNSTYAYSDLAEAYFSMGQVEKALKYQAIAVEKSLARSEWHQTRQLERLEKYRLSLVRH